MVQIEELLAKQQFLFSLQNMRIWPQGCAQILSFILFSGLCYLSGVLVCFDVVCAFLVPFKSPNLEKTYFFDFFNFRCLTPWVIRERYIPYGFCTFYNSYHTYSKNNFHSSWSLCLDFYIVQKRPKFKKKCFNMSGPPGVRWKSIEIPKMLISLIWVYSNTSTYKIVSFDEFGVFRI